MDTAHRAPRHIRLAPGLAAKRRKLAECAIRRDIFVDRATELTAFRPPAGYGHVE